MTPGNESRLIHRSDAMRVPIRMRARHGRPDTSSTLRSAWAVIVAVLLTGCSTPPQDEREAKKIELDAMADATIATLLADTPGARDVLEQSPGYMVVDMKVTKVPVFGAGKGFAVVVDRRVDRRSYLAVSRFEVGGGLGAQAFKVIVVFTDARLLDKAAGGAWHYEAGADLVAGGGSSEGPAQENPKGFHAYRISDRGAAATVTVRVARGKPF